MIWTFDVLWFFFFSHICKNIRDLKYLLSLKSHAGAWKGLSFPIQSARSELLSLYTAYSVCCHMNNNWVQHSERLQGQTVWSVFHWTTRFSLDCLQISLRRWHDCKESVIQNLTERVAWYFSPERHQPLWAASAMLCVFWRYLTACSGVCVCVCLLWQRPALHRWQLSVWSLHWGLLARLKPLRQRRPELYEPTKWSVSMRILTLCVCVCVCVCVWRLPLQNVTVLLLLLILVSVCSFCHKLSCWFWL